MFLRLVDELNSNDEGEWRTNSQSSLDDIDLKLLAAFGPSSQQDMQVGSTSQLLCFDLPHACRHAADIIHQALLPRKSPEFWSS